MVYDDYVRFVRLDGHEPMPILAVAMRSALEIFNTGNCSLGKDTLATASFGEGFPEVAENRANIGMYEVDKGLKINPNGLTENDIIGYIAGFPIKG